MENIGQILSQIPWKFINEVLFWSGRVSYFVIIVLAIFGATFVILKFSLGLKFSQIGVFKDKNVAEKLTSAFLDQKEKTAQQRLSRGKLNLIQRTMFFLCVSDILLCINTVIFLTLEIPFMKMDYFKNTKTIYYQIYRHGLRTLGHTRMFFFFLTASWSVCYLIALFQSLNKLVWTNKGCSILKYDICFHLFSIVGSFVFFLIWAVFRNGWLILVTFVIQETPLITAIEDFVAGTLYLLTFLGNSLFFVLNAATVLSIVYIVRRNIIKAKSLGAKSQNVLKEEGKFFFFFTKFLFANFIFFFTNGVYWLYLALGYYLLPIFDITDNFTYDILDYLYSLFFPIHGLLLFIAMIINSDHVISVMTCCYCCDCLPDWCLRTFCCGRKSRRARQKEGVFENLNEYSQSMRAIERMNRENLLVEEFLEGQSEENMNGSPARERKSRTNSQVSVDSSITGAVGEMVINTSQLTHDSNEPTPSNLTQNQAAAGDITVQTPSTEDYTGEIYVEGFQEELNYIEEGIN